MENQLRETLARAMSLLANKPDPADTAANEVATYADLAPVLAEVERILGLLPARVAFAALKGMYDVQVMSVYQGDYYSGRSSYGSPATHSPESYGPVLREVYNRLSEAGYKRQLSFQPGGPNFFHLVLALKPSNCL